MATFKLMLVILFNFGLAVSAAFGREFKADPLLACDTVEQAVRVAPYLKVAVDSQIDIEHSPTGIDLRRSAGAIAAMNAAEGEPACVVLNLVYLAGNVVSEVRSETGTYQIVKVMAVGLLQYPKGIAPLDRPVFQFAIVKVDERRS